VATCRYSALVVTWPEALQRIGAGSHSELIMKRKRLAFHGVPIAVAGNPGSGKTQLWSRLTTRSPPGGMSLATDDGYMVLPHKRAIALTTIPGQLSRIRFFTMDEIFSAKTRLKGVVFMTSFGFDHIWPLNADVVASNLQHLTLDELRERNMREELSNFQEVCNRIVQKHLVAPTDHAPDWLLVVVNKLDLYWDDRIGAEHYYFSDAGSPFTQVAQELINRVGTLALTLKVLPLASESTPYHFDSTWGHLTAPSQLTPDQCDSSVACLAETLEELCGS
jgi:hypothetical protein